MKLKERLRKHIEKSQTTWATRTFGATPDLYTVGRKVYDVLDRLLIETVYDTLGITRDHRHFTAGHNVFVTEIQELISAASTKWLVDNKADIEAKAIQLIGPPGKYAKWFRARYEERVSQLVENYAYQRAEKDFKELLDGLEIKEDGEHE